MCIICSNQELGIEYLEEWNSARNSLKRCEKILLELSNPKNINFGDEPELMAKNYNKAHKMLVRMRKNLDKVEKQRELK